MDSPIDAVSLWRPVLEPVAHALRERGVHAARTVVLLPYAQLMPIAVACWMDLYPGSFLPHFETTSNWAARVATFIPAGQDLRMDPARDVLTAQWLLQQSAAGAQLPGAAAVLLQAALELAPCVAAIAPAQRPDWMARTGAAAAPSGIDALDGEAVLERLAIAWAGSSAYATDVLFAPAARQEVDLLCVLPGLAHDALAESLQRAVPERALLLARIEAPALNRVAVRACADAADEAEQTAAVVLTHVAAGRTPVGLVATDRALTRRVTALLAARGVVAGVNLRDETGWKLSTTHAAAVVRAAVRAGAPAASADEVLDWAKLLPRVPEAALRPLEHALRRRGVQSWRRAARLWPDDGVVRVLEAQRQQWPAAPRPLARWLRALQQVLDGAGLGPLLRADSAGVQVIAALGLEPRALAAWEADAHAARPLARAAFARWLEGVLEAAHFHPPACPLPAVIVLPLAQVMGRPLAALVLPGADETQLPMAPEPPGRWSAMQRAALGLPTRAQLQDEQTGAWQHALGIGQVELLWCRTDDRGEPQLPSPRVEMLRLDGAPGVQLQAPDPRARVDVVSEPVHPPQADGSALPVSRISASAYESLRRCPYQFFALRQLGLQEEEELDQDPSKRDWGTWVHAVLRAFHLALQKEPARDREALMVDAATAVTHAQGLDETRGAFLPFAASWLRLRTAYLAWLQAHEAAGYRFAAAEVDGAAVAGTLQLIGRMDRQDRAADGSLFLMDYKTEALQKTQARVKPDSEDIQLPFYALLAQTETVRAAYLNLAEREAPSLHEVHDLQELASLLARGMQDDFDRIAAGTPIQALGQGSVCDWCPVRGLCRKDFWS